MASVPSVLLLVLKLLVLEGEAMHPELTHEWVIDVANITTGKMYELTAGDLPIGGKYGEG